MKAFILTAIALFVANVSGAPSWWDTGSFFGKRSLDLGANAASLPEGGERMEEMLLKRIDEEAARWAPAVARSATKHHHHHAHAQQEDQEAPSRIPVLLL